jgi:hypothetical protein
VIYRLRVLRAWHDVHTQGVRAGNLDKARRSMGAVELAMRACILASRHGGAMCFGESSSSDDFGASQNGAKRKCARRSRREAAATTTIEPQKAIGHRFAAALDLWV